MALRILAHGDDSRGIRHRRQRDAEGKPRNQQHEQGAPRQSRHVRYWVAR